MIFSAPVSVLQLLASNLLWNEGTQNTRPAAEAILLRRPDQSFKGPSQPSLLVGTLYIDRQWALTADRLAGTLEK